MPDDDTKERLLPDHFIVAEVSKNWPEQELAGMPRLLSERFERVINVNRARGYRLHSFSLHRLMAEAGQMNETIIAVFEREQP